MGHLYYKGEFPLWYCVQSLDTVVGKKSDDPQDLWDYPLHMLILQVELDRTISFGDGHITQVIRDVKGLNRIQWNIFMVKCRMHFAPPPVVAKKAS